MLNMVISHSEENVCGSTDPAATIIQSLIVSGVGSDQKKMKERGGNSKRGRFHHVSKGILDFSNHGREGAGRGVLQILVFHLDAS